MAALPAGLEPVLQVVGEDGAEGRVRRGVVRVALEGLVQRKQTEAAGFDVAQRILHREEHGVFVETRFAEPAQRRVVVEDVEPAAEGGQREIVLPPLDLHLTDGDGGQAALHPNPVPASVHRDVQPELGAEEQQILVDVILGDGPGDLALGQIAGDGRPAAAPVGALEHIGREVALLVVREGGEDGVGVVLRRLQLGDVAELGNSGKGLFGAPGGAAVGGDVDLTVVGSDVEQPLGQR